MDPLDNDSTFYDPSTISSRQIGTRYGLFWALAAIVLGLVAYMLGWSNPQNANVVGGLITGVISFGIGIAMIVLPIQKARNELGGYITFGKAFSTGFWSVLIYVLISTVWTLLFMTLIAPEIMEQTTTAMVEQWEEQGLSEDQIESMSWMTNLFSNPISLAIFGAVSGLAMWTIIDLIIAAVLKKDPPIA